jgi:electron transfer flavoprotein beta subunit
MDVVVAVKQVPEISKVQVNEKTGTLIREGVAAILNPFCECALDHAVQLKSLHPGIRITALSMGPPQARSALMRALELGADRAVLVSDRKFAGADTWATALTLAEAIRLAVPGFRLVLVGKQAMDGDTAQVGPEIAEILNLPQLSYATGVELSATGKKVRVRREIENGWQVVEARLPALVSVSKGEPVRRAPSFADILAARQKPVEILGAADLPIAEADLGLSGSLTRVVNVFPPPARGNGRVMSHLEPADAAREIVQFLKERGFVNGRMTP